MSRPKRLLPYPEERALEDVAYGQGLVPGRIFSVLLHVWQVEVRATTTDDRPYELIDRYLERGIAEGGLGTVGELARFFSLEEPLVHRAVDVLSAIGHVDARHGTLAVTELGLRSLRDGRCYLVTREDRRKMYFDGFGSRPLSRRYYDSGVVTFLSTGEVLSAASGGFLMLHGTCGFRRQALAELAGDAERDRYNLPVQVDDPESLGETDAYLPLYVVRAEGRDGARYLAYSQIADVADREITEICATTPEIIAVLDSEDRAARVAGRETHAEWLRKRNLERHRPVRLDRGGWRVVLPASAFAPAGPVPLAKLGSFVVQRSEPLHLWCEDTGTRQRALLERVGAYLGPRSRTGPEAVRRIGVICGHLGFGSVDLAGVRRMALDAGKPRLAARIAELRD